MQSGAPEGPVLVHELYSVVQCLTSEQGRLALGHIQLLSLQAKTAERAHRKRERAEQREQRRLLRRKEREKKKEEQKRKLEEQ